MCARPAEPVCWWNAARTRRRPTHRRQPPCPSSPAPPDVTTATAARTQGRQQALRHRRRRRRRARQRQRRPRRRRVHRDHGPLGLRQVDPAARPRRPRPADVGRGVPRRHRDHLAQRQGADPAAPRPDRLHLPVVQPAPDHDRGGEHRAARCGSPAASRTSTGWRRSSRPSASTGRLSRTGRRSSPVASSSGSPRPGRWPSRPQIVFADEPTGALDSRSGAELLGFLRTAVTELGQTVVMVTHDADRGELRRPGALPRRRPHRRRDVRRRPPTRSSTT